MATLDEILEEQATFVGEAKKGLEANRNRPPAEATAIGRKEALVGDLKARVAHLTDAKTSLTEQLDRQIAMYEAEIEGLEKQIEEDNKGGSQR
jgi:hypothetical protein